MKGDRYKNFILQLMRKLEGADYLVEQKARSEFTRQLIASQEAERSRIAGELHDSLGQNLLLIKNRVQLAQSMGPDVANVRLQLEEIGKVSTLAIAEALTFHQSLGGPRKEARLRFLRDRWANRLAQNSRVPGEPNAQVLGLHRFEPRTVVQLSIHGKRLFCRGGH